MDMGVERGGLGVGGGCVVCNGGAGGVSYGCRGLVLCSLDGRGVIAEDVWG